MYDTRNVDAVAAALLDLMGCMNSPRQDDVLLEAAGVSLDRALFPLLVVLGRAERIGVAELAGLVGRDPSTVSRQLARLEQLGMVRRPQSRSDLRMREAAITKAGARTVAALSEARRGLLEELLGNWSAEERKSFAAQLQRFANGMKQKQQARS